MKKHFQYLKYLIRHKYFVFLAGRITGVSLWRLIIHDWSKFLPCEWFPYVEYFYGECAPRNGGCGVCSVAADFNRAWLHHQHRNPHHWQHWVLRNDDGTTTAVRMPDHFVREMVADWAGAGRAITGKWNMLPWYLENKDKMVLHPFTVDLVRWWVLSRRLDSSQDCEA